MALYLVHRTMAGEPIGVHSEAGEHYYEPTMEHLKRTFGTGGSRSWAEFVEEKTQTFNQRILWDQVEDDRTDLEDVLSTLRTQFVDG